MWVFYQIQSWNPLSWAGERLDQHYLLLLGDEGVKTLLCQEREKKHAIFLLYHIVVLTVIFNKWWLFVKENEGGVRRSSRTRWWRLSPSAGCVDVCVSLSYGFTHIGFQCATCCFLGGRYLSYKCEILIWLLYYYINIYVKVWMVGPFLEKGGFSNGKVGVVLTLVYLSPPSPPLHPSLHIHWRSQTVLRWRLFFRPKRLFSELLGCCTGR